MFSASSSSLSFGRRCRPGGLRAPGLLLPGRHGALIRTQRGQALRSASSRLDEAARENALAMPDRAGLRDDEPARANALRSVVLPHARALALEALGIATAAERAHALPSSLVKDSTFCLSCRLSIPH
jgi:hypothetical protein